MTHSSSANLYPMHARFPLIGFPLRNVSVLPHSPGTARALAGGAAQRSGLRKTKRTNVSANPIHRPVHGDLKRRSTDKSRRKKNERSTCALPSPSMPTSPYPISHKAEWNFERIRHFLISLDTYRYRCRKSAPHGGRPRRKKHKDNERHTIR